MENKPSPAPQTHAPAWLHILRAIVRLAYPLALMASIVHLFLVFGPCGWLWLVLLAGLLLLIAAPSEK